MTLLISGSNRAESATRHVTERCADLLAELGEPSLLMDLRDLHTAPLDASMYEQGWSHPFVDRMEAEVRAHHRMVFVLPEYNGSYPGALKLLIDALSVRDYPNLFVGKCAALVGTASGRAGNLLGITHFGAVLAHLGVTLMPRTLPMSLIDSLIDEQGAWTKAEHVEPLREHMVNYLGFAQQWHCSELVEAVAK